MSVPNQHNAGTQLNLAALIEALLFIAPEPVSVGQLAQALDVSTSEVEEALQEIEKSYQNRGLRLQRFGNRYQLTTDPAAAAFIEDFLGLTMETQLTRASLETLAIIAYQQPITRPQIEAIRGVNSDSVLSTLLSRGLIEDTGRADSPGRPFLYNTTPDFLSHFGLASLEDLPPLKIEKPIEDHDNNQEDNPQNE
jgi:segregation and condensation protein B